MLFLLSVITFKSFRLFNFKVNRYLYCKHNYVTRLFSLQTMQDSLKEFLKTSKLNISSSTSKKKKLHVVLGNEACDLDSTACAITLAHFLCSTEKNTDGTYAPLLNIPKADYNLKTEVKYLLNELQLDESCITFKDEIDLKSVCQQNRLTLSLVDFNAFPKECEQLEKCVVRIVDHHQSKKKRDGKSKVQVIIETVGSCSSLVTELILKDKEYVLPQSSAKLLYGAILIDTMCLEDSTRTTGKDVEMVSQLEKLFPDFLRKPFYESILKAKLDVANLSVVELMRKDLKVVSKTHKSKTVSVAIPVVNVNIVEFFYRVTDIEASFKEFLKFSNCQLLVLMFLEIHDDSIFRYLVTYSPNGKLQKKMNEILLSNKIPDFNLVKLELRPPASESIPQLENSSFSLVDSYLSIQKSLSMITLSSQVPFNQLSVSAFRQVNVSASRKAVLPVVENSLDQLLKCL